MKITCTCCGNVYYEKGSCPKCGEPLKSNFIEYNENDVGSEFDEEVDINQYDDIDYQTMQYIQSEVNKLNEQELDDLIKIYNEKYISCDNPVVHYKAELCIMRLEELRSDSNIEHIKFEDKSIEQNLDKIRSFINLLETEKIHIVSLSHEISSVIDELNYNGNSPISSLNNDIFSKKFPELIDEIIKQLNVIYDSYRSVNYD